MTGGGCEKGLVVKSITLNYTSVHFGALPARPELQHFKLQINVQHLLVENHRMPLPAPVNLIGAFAAVRVRRESSPWTTATRLQTSNKRS